MTYPLCTGAGSTGCKLPRTNDTTPQFRLNTSESATCALIDHGFDYNYTDAIAYDANSQCSTTGGTEHTCTLSSASETNRTGVHLFSVGCKDSSNNENLTSTFGLFAVNITDPGRPNVTIFLEGKPINRTYELGMFQFNPDGTEKSYMINVTITGDKITFLNIGILIFVRKMKKNSIKRSKKPSISATAY